MHIHRGRKLYKASSRIATSSNDAPDRRSDENLRAPSLEVSSASLSERTDWTRAQALAISKEKYSKLERGRYGPVYPTTRACYGFTISAKVKSGREHAVRDYAHSIETAVRDDHFFMVL